MLCYSINLCFLVFQIQRELEMAKTEESAIEDRVFRMTGGLTQTKDDLDDKAKTHAYAMMTQR